MKLMNNLHSTHPHFVRCIIPNEIKKSGHTDAPLVMHQLTCNGVLEGIRICQLGLPNKVVYPDFMVRYSICQPKLFADLKDNPKECAQKALVASGVDPENFRTGHTRVMFRAGKLAELEEIREAALSTIITKMQCHARVAMVKLDIYNAKKAEKQAFACLQRNVRLYYACKDWVWYKFYTMVKNESEKIIKKQKEEEMRRIMQAGLDKIQAKLDAAVAEREAVEATNANLAQNKAGLNGEVEAMGSVAAEDVSQIKEAEAQVDAANKKLNALKQKVAKEITDLKADLAKTKADLTALKDQTAVELSDMKAKHEGLVDDASKSRAVAIGKEANKQDGKMEIQQIDDEITRLVRMGTHLIREKKECMAATGSSQKMKWVHGRLVQLLEQA